MLTHTSPAHSDHYLDSKEVVNGNNQVAFIMLNSNHDACFQHGETSVPVIEGNLVHFDGKMEHNTVINSGFVHLLGPFEIGASLMPGDFAQNTVGGFNGILGNPNIFSTNVSKCTSRIIPKRRDVELYELMMIFYSSA